MFCWGLSNDTTLMQIQSGRTVPLKGLSNEMNFTCDDMYG